MRILNGTFHALPDRQKEITVLLNQLGTSEVAKIETLQCECAIIGHVPFFKSDTCAVCGAKA